jgi:hypothetical protein
MAKDLTVILDDRAGQLTEMGQALGDAGVNIEGISAATSDGVGVVHLLVENAMVAQNALILAGLKVEGEDDAIVIDLREEEIDRPGSLGRLTRSLSSRGVNVRVAYLATHDRAVLVTNDNDKAREALEV